MTLEACHDDLLYLSCIFLYQRKALSPYVSDN